LRQLPDIAAVEIAKLRKLGVALTDDDVVWLATLGYRVENPTGQTAEAAGCSEGLRMSNGVILRPLTVRASRWLDRYAHVFPLQNEIYAVGYAMAHDTSAANSASAAVDAVGAWADNLNVPAEELTRAVSRLLHSDLPDDPEHKPVDENKIIALLVAATGLPAEHWHLSTWRTLAESYGGAIRWAEMLAGTGKDPDAAESKTALRQFALAIQAITERGKPE
jgi:hypothetical protein